MHHHRLLRVIVFYKFISSLERANLFLPLGNHHLVVDLANTVYDAA